MEAWLVFLALQSLMEAWLGMEGHLKEEEHCLEEEDDLKEEEENFFLEISLGSVLHKAVALEGALRTCKAKAEESNSPNGGLQSTVQLSHADHQAMTMTTTGEGGGEEGKGTFTRSMSLPPSNLLMSLPDQWQRLTSYIVTLEKEVQFYKQLVQDIQAKQIEKEHDLQQQSPSMLNTTSAKGGLFPARHHHTGLGPGGAVTGRGDLEGASSEGAYNESLLSVFSYLSTRELCGVSRVCREWQFNTRHPSLWKRVLLSEIVLYPQVLQRLAKYCSSTETLILYGLMPPLVEYNEDLQSYIVNTRGNLEPGIQAIMTTSRGTIRSLTIMECNLMATESVLWLASVHCPNLQSLKYCSDEFPPTSHALWALANGCRHLKHLTLPPVLGSPHADCFNDDCLAIIARAWPDLLYLTIGGSAITAHGLWRITQFCQSLEYLEVIHGPCLHKEVVEQICCNGGRGLSSLVRLVLNFTPISHVALRLLIQSCKKLKSLVLHVTFTSYFTDNADPDSATKYAKIISNIKKLKKHADCKEILHVFEH